MKQTFYRRVGRKYVPVMEYDSEVSNSFTEGYHLVVCKPGSVLTLYDIVPEHAPLIAAAQVARDVMSETMRKELELKPSNKPITPEQRAAWDNLAQAFGDSLSTLESNSVYNVVNSGLDSLISEASKLLTNESVKLAYENFLLLSALTKGEKKNDAGS